MPDYTNDPMGQAILDYAKTGKSIDITVVSELCDDDIIPSAYLLRSYDEMPDQEKMALEHCSGKVLDIGAGSGIHAKILVEKGCTVSCIDLSPGAVEYMQSIGLDAIQRDFHTLNEGQYDTLLLLMNGIGVAGTLSNLERTLLHAKTLLTKKGKIICDSTDIKYLYEDDEGGMWMDLNAEYYGNFRFQMKYGAHISEWFDWLYVDFENLSKVAEKAGFNVTQLMEDDNHYLAELTLKQ